MATALFFPFATAFAVEGQRAIDKDWLDTEILYSGTVTVISSASDTNGISKSGEALLRLNKMSGKDRTFWLHTTVPGFAVMTIEVPRTNSAGEWIGTDGDINVNIKKNGNIFANGSDSLYKTRMQGDINPSQLRLKLETTALKNVGSKPAGAHYVFQYELKRVALEDNKKSTPAGLSGACRRVVWKLKTVANLYGGPMQTVRVPVCEN